jgi:tetratricopeptide (TPR) repeat protein
LELRTLRGLFLLNAGQPDAALAQLDSVLESAPQTFNAWGGRALVYLSRRQWTEAARDLTKVLELNPQSYAHRALRAQCFREQEKWVLAANDYHLIARLNTATRNDCAWVLANCPVLTVRDPAKAVLLAREAVDLMPSAGPYWNTLAVALYRAGDWPGSITAAKKSLELRDGGDSFDWFFLAMSHWKLDQKDEARSWYGKAADAMNRDQSQNKELIRFRAEAAELMGMKVAPASAPASAPAPSSKPAVRLPL